MRQRLLAAAVELIPERGWAAVSTRMLAERAGVTPSVVHYHFPSMRLLLDEAVVGVMRELLGQVDVLLERSGGPAEAVDALFASVAPYSGADPMSLLCVEGYLAATRDERLRERIAELVAETGRRFGAWLAGRGVPEPEATAAVLVSAVDGVLLHRGLGTGPDADAAARVLRRLVDRPGT